MYSHLIKIPPTRRLDALPEGQIEPFVKGGLFSRFFKLFMCRVAKRFGDKISSLCLRPPASRRWNTIFNRIALSKFGFRVLRIISAHFELISKCRGNSESRKNKWSREGGLRKQLQKSDGLFVKPGMISSWTCHAFERHRFVSAR